MSVDNRVRMNILLIDDDPDILVSIGDYLRDTGHRVFAVAGGAEGLETLRREVVDIVVTDLMMPGMDGFEVLREARRAWPGVEVIMVTAYGDVEGAVRAMREGAFDFFTKPVRLRELNASLERTVRFHALRREKDRYRERLDRLDAEERRRYGLSAIIGEGTAIRAVKGLIEQVCQTDATTVLVCGETGTGKEMVARAVHHGSGRAGGAFVAVDCSTVPEPLFESEFYGHVKGAFTGAQEAHRGYFEQASGGTLFLDEVGDMRPEMQARLLRTLEERRVRRVGGAEETPVDVRVVAATNKDLPGAISEGRFREDLYYRLNAFTIRVPPLRERPEDILPLARHFLDRYRREMRRGVAGFTPEAEALLRPHPFPGNVRELRNTVERAVILCRGDRVTPDDLLFESPRPAPPEGTDSLNIEEAERRLIREALRRSGGNQVQAARLLGISRDALRRRMESYQI
ncbi:MAG: hypothetical protein A3F84_01120 [Candidatus Handelsmanbacteria bacterium RIFCSPLOWO2_12_FULL_64_10]|uniref:Sigma-54-dependent Fis family transcriptional regulator n=1 Tax=Handelsmanbacteria sp. (strain RIFCSPLOWO2_12_FULL_64_10) TaxID=1817868 RepID=A0A1F6CD19_HANXR|nr:MAG: hypothetical protein A3F84_01120 [Candidatus Handelsmanbacteria bacterium RIFCSPLOWO2_12_FULL_64_10]